MMITIKMLLIIIATADRDCDYNDVKIISSGNYKSINNRPMHVGTENQKSAPFFFLRGMFPQS